MDGRTDEADGWEDVRTFGRTDGRTNERMDEQMNGIGWNGTGRMGVF